MEKITINTFKNDGTFEDIEKTVPKYVVDVNLFEKRVQTKYDALRNLELENNVVSLQKKFESKLKEKKISTKSFSEMVKSYENEESVIENLQIFESIYFDEYEKLKNAKVNRDVFKDKINARYESGKIPKIDLLDITYYTWVMFNSKATLTIPGMKVLVSDCINYGNNHFGSEKWSSERKADFTNIKSTCVESLSKAFNFSNSSEKEYKKINAAKNFPSKETEIVISAIYGSYESKGAGTTLAHLKESKATRQLLLAFFHWQGGAVEITSKTVKKLTALDV